MEFYKVLEKRKSIREFEKKNIPQSLLIKLVKAATKAASAANSQPWRFYIVQGKKRDKLSEILRERWKKLDFKGYNPGLKKVLQKMGIDMCEAPCIILIYLKKVKNFPDMASVHSTDLAAANLMNAAVAEGLGTCWINHFKIEEKKVNKALNIPKDEVLVAPLIIGYPKKGYKPLIREKKKLKEILFWR